MKANPNYQMIPKDTLVKYLMSRDKQIKSLQKRIEELENKHQKHQDFLSLL